MGEAGNAPRGPLPGADGDALRAALRGYTPEEIAALRGAGLIEYG